MSGVNSDILYCSTRIMVEFRCDIGNQPKKISGTGFAVGHYSEGGKVSTFFVTNKHNLDPTLKLGKNTSYKIHSIQIQCRKLPTTAVPTLHQGKGEYYVEKHQPKETKIFEIPKPFNILHSATSDVSIIYGDFLHEAGKEGFALTPIFPDALADKSFFYNNISVMDNASFIGFPGNNKNEWWDTEKNLAIARNVNIASSPENEFRNNSIRTSDTVLVSGLSFSGSSGSLVVSHAKGADKALASLTDEYTAPKVIGIMSGHWWEDNAVPDMFKQHSGLSYFTKSTSILELINSVADTENIITTNLGSNISPDPKGKMNE